MYYTIGEMAKKIEVNPSTLRYYDKEGLLPFVERSQSGIRMFKDQDLGMLNIIGCLKDTGMSIKDIKRFVSYYKTGDEDYEKRLKIIADQKASVYQQMAQLEANLEMLEYKDFYYHKAIELGSLSAVENIDKNQIPRKFLKFFK